MRRDDFRALKERRYELFGSARELHKKAEREQRNLTDAEQRQFDGWLREAERLNIEIDAADEEFHASQRTDTSSASLVVRRTGEGAFETTSLDTHSPRLCGP